MKLSTFLQLLEGSAYITTLKQLQNLDPKEGRFSATGVSPYSNTLSELTDFTQSKAFLLKQLSIQERQKFKETESFPGEHNQILADYFIEALSNRRCVWCWHRGGIESMALWNSYADHGVCIESSAKRISEAIGLSKSTSVAVAPVVYSQPSQRYEHLDCNDLLLRPFLQKSSSYSFEKEVRFVFKVQPDQGKMLFLPVRPRKLINRAVLSPFLPGSEGYYLRKQIEKKLPGCEVIHSTENSAEFARSDFLSECLYAPSMRVRSLATEQNLPPLLSKL